MSSSIETTPSYSLSQQTRAYVSQQHIPHRKPVPARSSDRIQPLTPIQQRAPQHAHNRTSSSAALPASASPNIQQSPTANGNAMYQPNYSYPQQSASATRRTLSNATTSTSSTTNGGPSNRKNSAGASTLQRTASNRSGTSSTSYVALMRKQKATVWSDRAQHEDPRLIAKQREAKMRAALDLSAGSHNTGRLSTSNNSSITGGMRAKIRHHGAPKAQPYNSAPNAASGVPMRLSAREVDDDESEDDRLAAHPIHQRSGSGRSSVGSQGRASSVYGPVGVGVKPRGSSEGNTPPQTRGNTMPADEQRPRIETPDSGGAEPTPIPEDYRSPDYFAPRRPTEGTTPGSTNSERENEFGGVGNLPHRVRDIREEESNSDDLQRRGSVDERSTTMRGYGRLFVANPDLDD